MTDYKRFQSFIQSKGLWDEFKKKTLKNYRIKGFSMLQYFNLVAYDKEELSDQSDLIVSAFCIVSCTRGNHPDAVWEQLHRDWIAELVSINYKFREITERDEDDSRTNQ